MKNQHSFKLLSSLLSCPINLEILNTTILQAIRVLEVSDFCHDSGGERSPLLPLEARPDSPGDHGMQLRDPCLPWRGALGPGHRPR